MLLAAIRNDILDSAELKVVYTPSGAKDQRGPGGNGGQKKGARK
jgi:hypothetical protein